MKAPETFPAGAQEGRKRVVIAAVSPQVDDGKYPIKRVPGVDSVDNRIEELPASPADDRIRWATFYAIYSDSFLSRYSPGGEMAAREAERTPDLPPEWKKGLPVSG